MIKGEHVISEPESFLIAEFRSTNVSDEYYAGIISDISDEGFSIESQSSEDLKQGEILEINLKHPQSELMVSVKGKVLWTKVSWYKFIVGIKYYRADENTKNRILELAMAVSDSKKPENEGGVVRVEDSICKAIDRDDGDTSQQSGTKRSPVQKFAFTQKENENLDTKETSTGDGKTGPEQGQTADPGIETERGDTLLPDSVLSTFENTPARNRKSVHKAWMYLAIGAAAALLFIAALPVIYQNLNTDHESQLPELAESTFQERVHQKQPEDSHESSQSVVINPGEPLLSEGPPRMLHDSDMPKMQEKKKYEENADEKPEELIQHVDLREEQVPNELMQYNTLDGQKKNEEGKGPTNETKMAVLNNSDQLKKKYVVAVYILNIRSAPSTSSSIVGKLKRGEVIISKGSDANDEGLWISLDKGYVFARYTIKLHDTE